LKNKKNWNLLQSGISGTTKERQAILDKLMEKNPSLHLERAAQDALGQSPLALP
jgi:hypothetical protein